MNTESTNSRPANATSVSALAGILRTYSYVYTAAHRLDAVASLMAEDYELIMGPHRLRGRDQAYLPAARHQFDSYPGLGFTVHRLVTNGDRAALHFSEHGRSSETSGVATWQGISLYGWNGSVLTDCRVEQDYHARAEQLATGTPQVVPPAHPDPWTSTVGRSRPDLESAIAAWLRTGRWLTDGAMTFDDGGERIRLTSPKTEVLDLFSADDTCAFHVRVGGRYEGGLRLGQPYEGRPCEFYATGLVTQSGHAISGQVVTDRRSLLRRLAESA